MALTSRDERLTVYMHGQKNKKTGLRSHLDERFYVSNDVE